MPSQSSFDALVEALSKCEDGGGRDDAKALLSSWPGDLNADIIVGPNDNRGSPLLIACELGLPRACEALVSLGADVNYRHPAPHGNSPLLRCAEMGYDDCLEALLASTDIDVVYCLTREYKLVLGQNVPQYEAGGRSALLLAVESSRVGAVGIFLREERGRRLIDLRDSFGRTPLEASFERLALREGKKCSGESEEICRIICDASGLDYDRAKAMMQPTEEAAKLRERERNVQLRARYLKKSNSTKEAEVARGLGIVRTKYNPLRLHPNVYGSELDSNALLLSIEGTSVLQRDPAISEPLPGTFSFPLLSNSHCETIYEEILHYEKMALDRPELGLPLHIRHDGNLGSLQHCGFQPLLTAIEALFQRLVSSLMPGKGHCEVYHAFLTRNHVARDENSGFKIHCDKSDLTFNICLQASDDLGGSTVGFYSTPPGAGSVPSETERVYTHVHRVGHAIMHDGRQWHKTDTITRGARSSLVVWARLSAGSCAECGARMGSVWLFYKQCGKETNNHIEI